MENFFKDKHETKNSGKVQGRLKSKHIKMLKDALKFAKQPYGVSILPLKKKKSIYHLELTWILGPSAEDGVGRKQGEISYSQDL